jgi:hypothetical protein
MTPEQDPLMVEGTPLAVNIGLEARSDCEEHLVSTASLWWVDS